MEYLNIVTHDRCTGCGLCKSICPHKAIEFVENDEGYLYPFFNRDLCINCGLCERQCTVKQEVKTEYTPKKAYSFFLNNKNQLLESASGGLVTALAMTIIDSGGIVYSCSYDDDYYDASFSICNSIESFRKYKSSIYFNTQPMDYKAIKKCVDTGAFSMVVGLPCQIGALRKYVGEMDNLLCISLICGGQEPRILHRKVLDEIRTLYPDEEITNVNYRYKKKNWNSTCLGVEFSSGKTHLGGGFFRMQVLRESCYHCEYKIDNSFADIIAGDFWGSELLGKEFHNEFGTSVAIAMTEKGAHWLKKAQVYGSLNEVSVPITYKTNTAIYRSKEMNPNRNRIISLIKEKSLLEADKEILGLKRYYLRKAKYLLKGLLPDNAVRIAKRIVHR